MELAEKLSRVNVENGVECKVLEGTTHGIGSYLHLCPDISVRQGALLAEFAKASSAGRGRAAMVDAEVVATLDGEIAAVPGAANAAAEKMTAGGTITVAAPFRGVDLLLFLAGQSNMAGRGDVCSPAYTAFLDDESVGVDSRARCFLFRGGRWHARPTEPLHTDKPGKAGVGPGLAAALTLARALPHLRVGIVATAFGGSEIDRWLPPHGDLLASATATLDAALATLERNAPDIAVLWHQGESDCLDVGDRTATYAKKLRAVMKHFVGMARARTQRRWNTFAIIAGQLGDFLTLPGADSVRGDIAALDAQQALAGGDGADDRCLYLVGSENLQHRGDHLHFDAPSCIALGKRYGRTLLSHLARFACTDLETTRLFDFSSDDAAAKCFHARDDRDMGGSSQSMLLFERPPKSDIGATLMTGAMAMEGGGFVSWRANLQSAHVDLARFEGLIVDCRSGENSCFMADCAQTYRVLLRTPLSLASGVSWSCSFRPGPNRGRHRLSFSEFVPRRRGRRAEGFPDLGADALKEVTSLSLLLARSDNPGFPGGKFYTRLFSIGAFRSRS